MMRVAVPSTPTSSRSSSSGNMMTTPITTRQRRRGIFRQPQQNHLFLLGLLLGVAYTRYFVWMVYNAPDPRISNQLIEKPPSYIIFRNNEEEEEEEELKEDEASSTSTSTPVKEGKEAKKRIRAPTAGKVKPTNAKTNTDDDKADDDDANEEKEAEALMDEKHHVEEVQEETEEGVGNDSGAEEEEEGAKIDTTEDKEEEGDEERGSTRVEGEEEDSETAGEEVNENESEAKDEADGKEGEVESTEEQEEDENDGNGSDHGDEDVELAAQSSRGVSGGTPKELGDTNLQAGVQTGDSPSSAQNDQKEKRVLKEGSSDTSLSGKTTETVSKIKSSEYDKTTELQVKELVIASYNSNNNNKKEDDEEDEETEDAPAPHDHEQDADGADDGDEKEQTGGEEEAETEGQATTSEEVGAEGEKTGAEEDMDGPPEKDSAEVTDESAQEQNLLLASNETTTANSTTPERHHRRRRKRKQPGPSYNRPTAIFFNMYLNPEDVLRSYNIVQEQLRQVNESTHQRHQSKVYFNLLGANVSEWDGVNISGTDYAGAVCANWDINCEFLDYYPNGNEQVTLHKLWSHCQDHPRHRVTYLHNKGSFRRERGNTKLRRLATRSALSPPCLRMPLSSTYRCNQCGIVFNTLPYFHWTTNIWTADCRYIQNLTSPLEYEQRRWNLFQEIWQEYSHCLPPFPNSTNLDELKAYGLGRYSMERWIFSHPHMLPCDLTPLRLGRFQRGFEWWFKPKLRESRHLQETPKFNESNRNLYFLLREHQAFHPGYNQTDVLQRYVAPVQPLQACWSDTFDAKSDAEEQETVTVS